MTARRLLPLLLLLATGLRAHIGSPDVFYEGSAGPYRLLVTIRPPAIVPGVAQIEIHSAGAGVRQVRIVPLPLTGPGARFAPTPDIARQSPDDPRSFTGSLWLMSVGEWQVRIHAEGDHGAGELAVPVPALPTRIRTMQTGIGALLFGLMLILALGIVSIVGAGVREGQLDPGDAPSRSRIRRARVLMAAAAMIVAVIVAGGNRWWDFEADNYSRILYKPLQLAASLEPQGRLMLRMEDPGWLRRKVDDLIPDHTHLMHLYVIRLPAMERVWHLHPDQIAPGVFAQNLPDMPAGRYQIFGDIVHASGVPETVTAEVDLPQVAGKPLSGDDAAGSGPPISSAGAVSPLPGGGRLVWLSNEIPPHARQLSLFRFRVEGRTASLEPYMGMLGHAAFVKSDRTVFAHVHPSGSVPMAALSLTGNPHAGHQQASESPNVVSFPYGFPAPGLYRIYVQIKLEGHVETGVFDAQVN